MATKRFDVAGLSFAVFGGRGRLGLEFSLPSNWFGIKPPPDFQFQAEKPASRADLPPNASLAERVQAVKWYHTIDLGSGVVSSGFFDHRPILSKYPLPENLAGQRVLDVAKFDGFWAFEFERRGASEVVALDIETAAELDLPFRTRRVATPEELGRRFDAGFVLAREALSSKVVGLHANVYDLDPDRHGMFDLVHCGDLLLHLRDPALALSRMRSVTRGTAIISDTIYPDCDRLGGAPMIEYQGGRGDNVWWRFGATALRRMIEDAEFSKVEEMARFEIAPVGSAKRITHVVFRAEP